MSMSKCVDKQIYKHQYIRIMNTPTGLKMNKLLLYVTAWIDFRNNVEQMKQSQKEYKEYSSIIYI